MYLIDENLPPALAELFRSHGLEAKHINEYGANKPIKDDGIRRYALRFPDTVIVTRDDDFVRSYFSRKVPEKVLFVFQLQRRDEIIEAFERHIASIPDLFEKHELFEVDLNELKIHS